MREESSRLREQHVQRLGEAKEPGTFEELREASVVGTQRWSVVRVWCKTRLARCTGADQQGLPSHVKGKLRILGTA